VIKNILATVDGSAYSNAVVRQSIELAQKYNALLRFLTIVDVRIFEWAIYIGADGFMPMIPSSTYQKETQKVLEEKAEEVLKKCAQQAEDAAVEFVTSKVSGSPVEVICELARRVDLVIMGRRGEYARWGGKLMGDTLDGTVRQANKPILVLPKEYRAIRRMLLAYDRSPQANHALQLAADFALRLNSPLVVLAVDDDAAHGQTTVAEAMEYLSPFGLKVSSQVSGGGASEQILRVCDAQEVDLVIMGAHGHTRLREALLGSTTEDVLRRIDLPLLLVR
jgi:nucleotide-binding universal stress UspA family protein